MAKNKQRNQLAVAGVIIAIALVLVFFKTDSSLSVAYQNQCSLPSCPSGYSLQDKYCEGTNCYGECEKPVPAYCGTYGNWFLKEATEQWDGDTDRGDYYESPKLSMGYDKCYIAKSSARFIPTDMGSAGSYNLYVSGTGYSDSKCMTGSNTLTTGLQEKTYGHSPGTSTWTSASVTDYGYNSCGGGDPWTNAEGLITISLTYKEAEWIDDEVITQNVDCSFECNTDSDCGSTGYVGSKSCSGGNVVQNYESNTCQSYQCDSSQENQIVEFCDYGCESGSCIQKELVNYYRLNDNQCSLIQIYPSDATGSDYTTLADCQSHIQEQDILVYRLDNSCNSAYIKVSQRTDNDYDTKALCLSQMNQKVKYYRLQDNDCSEITIYPSEKTQNDYPTLAECETAIEGEPPIFENLLELILGGIVVLLLIIFLIVWLVKRKPNRTYRRRR